METKDQKSQGTKGVQKNEATCYFDQLFFEHRYHLSLFAMAQTNLFADSTSQVACPYDRCSTIIVTALGTKLGQHKKTT